MIRVFVFLIFVSAFSISATFVLTPQPQNRQVNSLLFMGKKRKKKNKISYAERLQIHREKIASEQGVVEPAATSEQPKQETNYTDIAKQMVEAQKRSVDMLTFVKERVEGLLYDAIQDGLEKEGYVVVDDFMSEEGIISIIEEEGLALFNEGMMETDLTRLGSGEYIGAIEGGEAQYLVCPRTIELVVSATKTFGAQLHKYNLDNSNCVANMRTFDHSSKEASLALIEGGELMPQPYDSASQGENDLMRISLFYYPTAEGRSDGGIVVEKGERLVSAKRDRLILMLSNSCRYRPEYFRGNDDDMRHASYLELHLIGKSDSVVD